MKRLAGKDRCECDRQRDREHVHGWKYWVRRSVGKEPRECDRLKDSMCTAEGIGPRHGRPLRLRQADSMCTVGGTGCRGRQKGLGKRRK